MVSGLMMPGFVRGHAKAALRDREDWSQLRASVLTCYQTLQYWAIRGAVRTIAWAALEARF